MPPTARPTTPAAPTPMAILRCRGMPVSCVAGGAVMGAASSGGIFTLTVAPPAPTAASHFHGFLPGAEASTTRVPGSTGTPVPHCASSTGSPSRVMVRPATFESAGTSIVRRESLGKRASARSFAMSARGSGGVRLRKWGSHSRNFAHALARRPTCS